jgi:excisionase family DNA binding protein
MPTPLSHRPGDIAGLTGLSKPFIYKLIAEGRLPAVHIGRSISVLHADLIAFLEANRSGGAA